MHEQTPARGDADLSNWRTSPHSRWAFHNVGELVPHLPIANDPARVSPLSPSSRNLDAFELTGFDGSNLNLEQFVGSTATDALIVLVDGQVAHESYYNGNTPETPHILMSSTKAVMGLVAGILEQSGGINLDDPASRYVPEVADTAYGGATLRNLTDMRTGVKLDERQQRAYQLAMNWNPAIPGEEPQDLHRFLSHLAVTGAPHGGPFSYISGNTDLLGWALERATGRSVASLISDLLWKPMGAETAGYITVDSKDAPLCTGGIGAVARDFARIGQLLVDGGRSGDAKVIPPSLIADIASNGDPEAWSKGEWGSAFASISTQMSYRRGWYIKADAPKVIFAMGIHGQNLFIDVENRIVVAKFSSWAESTDYSALPLTHMAINSIRRCLTGAP